MNLESVAQKVIYRWNEVALAVVPYAESVSNESMADDFVFQSLQKLDWPLRIGIVQKVPTGSSRLQFVEFDVKMSEDRKTLAAVTTVLAAILREVSHEHTIAVFDKNYVGFGLRYDGGDDMTKMDIWPDLPVC